MHGRHIDGELLLGRIAVHFKMITIEQLAEVTRHQGRVGGTKRLGTILVDQGLISQEQLAYLLEAQRTYNARRKAQLEAERAARADAERQADPKSAVTTTTGRLKAVRLGQMRIPPKTIVQDAAGGGNGASRRGTARVAKAGPGDRTGAPTQGAGGEGTGNARGAPAGSSSTTAPHPVASPVAPSSGQTLVPAGPASADRMPLHSAPAAAAVEARPAVRGDGSLAKQIADPATNGASIARMTPVTKAVPAAALSALQAPIGAKPAAMADPSRSAPAHVEPSHPRVILPVGHSEGYEPAISDEPTEPEGLPTESTAPVEASQPPAAQIVDAPQAAPSRQERALPAPQPAAYAVAPAVQAHSAPAPVSAVPVAAAPARPRLPAARPMPTRAEPLAPEERLPALVERAIGAGASDLHLHSGTQPLLRVRGELEPMSDLALDGQQIESQVLERVRPDEREHFAETGELDFACTLPDLGRLRCNIYRQQRGVDCVMRLIPPKPPTLSELSLPSSLAKLTTYHQGLVLATGPSGCGKSSTLAALLNIINEERSDHILTIEDPIEYVHESKRCVVNQRQVGPHTGSFARALKAALREDPDVIVIGELRDFETISLALTAAETGHVVMGTLHTGNTIRTISRLLGVFPHNQQGQVRAMLSESLRAVVSQRLVATADEGGRVPAVEVMIVNKAIGCLVRENKTHQIRSALQTGGSRGMCLLDQSLTELVRSGTVTAEEAANHADEPKLFRS